MQRCKIGHCPVVCVSWAEGLLGSVQKDFYDAPREIVKWQKEPEGAAHTGIQCHLAPLTGFRSDLAEMTMAESHGWPLDPKDPVVVSSFPGSETR